MTAAIRLAAPGAMNALQRNHPTAPEDDRAFALVGPLMAVAPIPELGFVLQLTALGGAVGGLVAARARRRDPTADSARITSAWASLGLLLGSLILVVVSIAG